MLPYRRRILLITYLSTCKIRRADWGEDRYRPGSHRVTRDKSHDPIRDEQATLGRKARCQALINMPCNFRHFPFLTAPVEIQIWFLGPDDDTGKFGCTKDRLDVCSSDEAKHMDNGQLGPELASSSTSQHDLLDTCTGDSVGPSNGRRGVMT